MPLDSQIPLMGYQVPKIDYQARQEGDLRLKQLMMQDKLMQQQMADDQAQRQAFSQSGGDSDAYLKALAQGQNPKAYNEALKAAADRKKAGFDTDKAQLESALKKLELGGQLFSGIKDQQSYLRAKQQAQAYGLDVSGMPDVYDPVIVEQNRLKSLSVKDQITQALQQKQFDETARHNTATERLTLRGQNMADSRAREATAATIGKPFEVTGPDGNPILVQQDKTGKISPVQGYGPKAGEKTGSKVGDAKDVLALLDQAEPLVKEATSSYSGAGIDEFARVFGASTEGANAAAQLRALEGALISKMPKMSGPQSDKDVLLYKQMAGQIGDRTIPVGQKLAAMKTIREINERYAGLSSSAPAQTKAGASVSNW